MYNLIRSTQSPYIFLSAVSVGGGKLSVFELGQFPFKCSSRLFFSEQFVPIDEFVLLPVGPLVGDTLLDKP